MTLPLKKLARPTIRRLNEDPDPLGFAKMFPQLSTQLEKAYQARLHAFLRQFLLVKLEPAVLRSMLDAATTQGRPVNYELSITAYPRKAHGLARVVGELKAPPHEPQADEDNPDGPEYGPWIKSIFGNELVRARRPKRGWRNKGRAG